MFRRQTNWQTESRSKAITVVGAGLAGAACAQVFAREGYRVTVYDQADRCAAGASGVPIALFAPSISADDAPHSRLLRSGVHVLVDELQHLTQAGLLVEGQDWAMTGVLERCIRIPKKLPTTWLEPKDPPSLQSIMLETSHSVGSRSDILEIFHGMAGWVDPQRLVTAWLKHGNIDLRLNEPIDQIDGFLGGDVIVACGYQTPNVLPECKEQLQPIRGQVEWGDARHLPVIAKHPSNGMGHFIQTPLHWLAGATFQRDEIDLMPRVKDRDLNFHKLNQLLPVSSKPYFSRLNDNALSWVGVRTAQKNRAPLVQKIQSHPQSNLWVCTGLGSRGLSLATLCARRLLASFEHRVMLH